MHYLQIIREQALYGFGDLWSHPITGSAPAGRESPGIGDLGCRIGCDKNVTPHCQRMSFLPHSPDGNNKQTLSLHQLQIL
jgi:hypothetical protein